MMRTDAETGTESGIGIGIGMVAIETASQSARKIDGETGNVHLVRVDETAIIVTVNGLICYYFMCTVLYTVLSIERLRALSLFNPFIIKPSLSVLT
jgi:hypothetical protein